MSTIGDAVSGNTALVVNSPKKLVDTPELIPLPSTCECRGIMNGMRSSSSAR
jgi:hypothetical protein